MSTDEVIPPAPDSGEGIPDEAYEFLNRIRVELDSQVDESGFISSDFSRNLIVSCPEFTLLAHHAESGRHPESPEQQWAGVLAIPGGSTYKAIVETGPPGCYVVLLRDDWDDFMPRHVSVMTRARDIEKLGAEGMIPEALASAMREFWGTYQQWKTAWQLRLNQINRDQGYGDEQVFKAEVQRRELEPLMDERSGRLSGLLVDAFKAG